jgi:DNA-binding CsgD family transcriptional regulator
MNVDPDSRLVADSLEAEWNQALRALADAKDHCEKQSEADRAGLSDAQCAAIAALARDFPRLWNDPHTPQRERKRMARLLIADVTLLKDKELRVQVRFNGGTTHTITLHLPKSAWMLRQTSDTVVREIDRLLDGHTDAEIAEFLNSHGMTSGEGKPFSRLIVRRIRINYELESRYSRLRARGLLSVDEIASALGVRRATIQLWRRVGLLAAHRCDDKGQYLFERPGPDTPVKYQRQGKTTARSIS